MKLQITASISATAAALMLVSCASKSPLAPSEYQTLVDNATSKLVCKREAVTGSRIQGQVCFTQAQLKEQRDRAVEVMRDMQQRAAMTRSMEERPPPMPPSAPRSGP